MLQNPSPLYLSFHRTKADEKFGKLEKNLDKYQKSKHKN